MESLSLIRGLILVSLLTSGASGPASSPAAAPNNCLPPPVNVACRKDTEFPLEGMTVQQYECDIILSKAYRGPANNAACVTLACANFTPGTPCVYDTLTDCNLNILPGCRSPFPLYPGSIWNFGLHTTNGTPSVAWKSLTPANGSGECPW